MERRTDCISCWLLLQVTQQQAHVAGIVEGAAAMQQQGPAAVHSREASFSESPEIGLLHDDDT